MSECAECQRPADCRPYGDKGSMICFDCAMKPKNKARTERNYNEQLDAAVRASDEFAAIDGKEHGIRPATAKERADAQEGE